MKRAKDEAALGDGVVLCVPCRWCTYDMERVYTTLEAAEARKDALEQDP